MTDSERLQALSVAAKMAKAQAKAWIEEHIPEGERKFAQPRITCLEDNSLKWDLVDFRTGKVLTEFKIPPLKQLLLPN